MGNLSGSQVIETQRNVEPVRRVQPKTQPIYQPQQYVDDEESQDEDTNDEDVEVEETFTVTKITDGDTIHVKDSQNKKIIIRLAHIDAPELKQEGGKEAKKELTKLIPLNSKVTLDGEKSDQYRRKVRVVYNEDKVNVNKQMLKLGMASYYNRKKSSPREYLDAEDEARKSKKGIWSKEHESPASFRKRTKAPRKR